MNLKFFRQF